MASPPIVLTTDFGLADPYAGVMKGVILGIAPGAVIIDLTHHVQPQNVRQGAFILGTSHGYFPAGTIHAAVVDPGVGTERRALLLETPAAKFVAPDNGLLSRVLDAFLETPPAGPGRVILPPNAAAYHLTNPEYWLHPLSRTFHGRDVFAPVAAHLSLGVPPEDLGRRVHEMAWLPLPQPERREGAIAGEVIYADHFGNLVTNIPGSILDGATGVAVEISGREIRGLSRTFHDAGTGEGRPLIALVGSLGYLEIAAPDASAAALLGVGEGERVLVRRRPAHG